MPGTAERFRISGKSGSEFPEPTVCKEIAAFARLKTIRRTSFGVRWIRNHLQRVRIFQRYLTALSIDLQAIPYSPLAKNKFAHSLWIAVRVLAKVFFNSGSCPSESLNHFSYLTCLCSRRTASFFQSSIIPMSRRGFRSTSTSGIFT